MTTIVYSSNTGYTKEYAEMLSKKCNLTAYSLSEAEKILSKDSDVIFMSWLMAGAVVNIKKAQELFNVKAVCAVGLCETGTLVEETRKINKLSADLPIFTLQGGYAPESLHGLNKFIMKIVTKLLINKINKIETPTQSDLKMKEVLKSGGSFVSEENLKNIVEFLG